MGEFSPERGQNQEPERIDLKGLSFDELRDLNRESSELAASTFQEVENGFVNANGKGIFMEGRKGMYKISEISSELPKIHVYVSRDELLSSGSENKEEMVQGIRDMMEELDCRVIE